MFGHVSTLSLTPSPSVSVWEEEQPVELTDSPLGVFGHVSTPSITPSPSVSVWEEEQPVEFTVSPLEVL